MVNGRPAVLGVPPPEIPALEWVGTVAENEVRMAIGRVDPTFQGSGTGGDGARLEWNGRGAGDRSPGSNGSPAAERGA